MPCLAACSMFRSGKGTGNIFVSNGSLEFTNSMKRKLDGKTVQHLLRHPAHEALTRLLIIKAIIQIDDATSKKPKTSIDCNIAGKPAQAKEKVSPFSKDKKAMEEIIGMQGSSLSMPANLSRGHGYTATDIQYFKHLVTAINSKERPEMHAEKPIPKRFFFNLPEDSCVPPRKRSHDEIDSHPNEPSQLLMPIILLDEAEEQMLPTESQEISTPCTPI